jgi:hypothetical protein
VHALNKHNLLLQQSQRRVNLVTEIAITQPLNNIA